MLRRRMDLWGLYPSTGLFFKVDFRAGTLFRPLRRGGATPGGRPPMETGPTQIHDLETALILQSGVSRWLRKLSFPKP